MVIIKKRSTCVVREVPFNHTRNCLLFEHCYAKPKINRLYRPVLQDTVYNQPVS